MIARALASDPRIILLDEATSALDNVTQGIVMRSILGQSVTRVAIAHRLTTVERADRILVVSGGRIVEEGTPADLLASGGHFARLAARQEY
jgi:ABC-type multidrug transport system fused ATPase/permease subunit